MDYFYARVSTKEQNADRQLIAASRAGIAVDRIYVDYESGKDFDRTKWTLLQEQLTAGDVLFVKSIDRLGRNYKEILRVWSELTHERSVDVVVLDMPLLDTRRDKNLLGTFIADLVLQVLSFVAENERVNIKERQREGIAAAKERGVTFGRPRAELPDNFDEIVEKYASQEITQAEGARLCGLPLTTFRNAAARAGVTFSPRNVHRGEIERGIIDDWYAGKITAEQGARRAKCSLSKFFTSARRTYPNRKTYRQERALQNAEAKRAKRAEVRKRTDRFRELGRLYLEGEVTSREAAEELGIGSHYFVDRVNFYVMKGTL